jgi:hypothetical protein
MKLTDLIPAGKWHELTHRGETAAEHNERTERIKAAYGQGVQECIEKCGPNTDDPQTEYAMQLTTLCLADAAITQATAPKPTDGIQKTCTVCRVPMDNHQKYFAMFAGHGGMRIEIGCGHFEPAARPGERLVATAGSFPCFVFWAQMWTEELAASRCEHGRVM